MVYDVQVFLVIIVLSLLLYEQVSVGYDGTLTEAQDDRRQKHQMRAMLGGNILNVCVGLSRTSWSTLCAYYT